MVGPAFSETIAMNRIFLELPRTARSRSMDDDHSKKVDVGVTWELVISRFRHTWFATIWLDLGWVPVVIALTFFWGLAVIIIKWRKLALQKRALEIRVVPLDYGFVLSPQSADLPDALPILDAVLIGHGVNLKGEAATLLHDRFRELPTHGPNFTLYVNRRHTDPR